VYDDGILDPRDTRDVLGMCLSVAHTAPVQGAGGYGVWRH
jgi:acetyl-CoA carboxylase carboxyltransferase component